MDFFRNTEVRVQLCFSLLFVAVLALAGLLLCPKRPGCMLLLAAGGMMLTAFWTWFTWQRYQKLGQLAAQLDRLLHGEREWKLEQYQEGELAILTNEIQKLLKRLTEQSETLRRDKLYLSDSLADISHQLRTPLTSMHLFMTRLSKETGEQERRKLICEGEQLLDRIDWLVNALLKISKIDAGTVPFAQERTDAKELMEKALEPLRIPMELREQSVSCEVEEGTGFTGDIAWSTEAFGNILKNCMEHMGQGGTLRIRAEENQLYTEFRIEDTGPGIAPEDLPHLFERFYKGKGASDSSVGIGLALSRMIISAQNGTVKAENRPEGGARFVVRFYKGIV